MLRKFTHIVLTMFLMVATTGVTFSMHYCGGKLKSVSINYESKSCCDMKGGCCHNESIHFEVKEDFVSPVYVENDKVVELDILFPILFVLDFELLPEVEKTFETFPDTSAPPTIQTRLSLLQTYLC